MKHSKYKTLYISLPLLLLLSSLAVFIYLQQQSVLLTYQETNQQNLNGVQQELSLLKNAVPEWQLIEKLVALDQSLKIENSETFSYPGCAFIHGPDAQSLNWKNLGHDRLNELFQLFSLKAKDLVRIQEDYTDLTKGYETLTTDELLIKVCDCQAYKSVHDMINNQIPERKLNLSDIILHSSKDEPLKACIDYSNFD